MADAHSLIATVAVGLSFAFVGGGIAHRLRLPPLVGYLLGGVLIILVISLAPGGIVGLFRSGWAKISGMRSRGEEDASAPAEDEAVPA